MRRLGALLAATVVLAACDDGPDAVGGDVTVIRADMQPEPLPDADIGPADRGVVDARQPEAGPPPDGHVPDMGQTDMDRADVHPPDPGPCAEPDGVIALEPMPANGFQRVELRDQATESRLAPDCGGDPAALTAGHELKVRVVPALDGEHLVVASGRFSALYRTTACGGEDPPEVLDCLTMDGAFENANRRSRIVLRAGQAIDIVADAPADRQAGPFSVNVYPPVPEGGSCAAIDPGGARPACTDEGACFDDRCVYAGAPRIDAGNAWTDGQSLRVAVDYSGVGVVEAIWVRADDGDFTQLRLTVVEQAPTGGRLGGYIEDRRLADSDRIELELLDGDERPGRARLDVIELEPLAPAAPCDPSGLRDTCRPGDACVNERCRPTTVGAWRTDDGLNLDVQAPRIPPEVEDVNAVVRPVDAAPDTRWSALPERAAEIGRRWTAIGLEEPESGLAVRFQATARPPGLPLRIQPEPQPVREQGEPCDPAQIADRCAAELACLDDAGIAQCRAIDPPEILDLQGWAAPDAIGLKLTFVDPQNDTDRLRLAVYDRDDDSLRFETPEAVPLRDGAAGAYADSLPAPWGPRPGDHLEVELLDATDQVSEAVSVRLDEPPVAQLGDPCDPLGARAVCEDEGAICAALDADGPPRCEPFDAECPEAWNPFPLVVPARHDDNTFNGPDRTAGLCGGAGSPEAIYELRAAADARWRISVLPPGATVYMRSHCRFAVEDEAEIACDVDGFEVDVEAGETYYLFVDGPQDGRRFALLVDEVRGPIGLPDPDPVD